MAIYRATAEFYMLLNIVAHPVLCVLGWVLFRRMAGKRLQSYMYWTVPGFVGVTLTTGAVFLLAYFTFFHHQAYGLGALAYLLSVGGMVLNIVGFVRFWKTITGLPPEEGKRPWADAGELQEGIWPPPPRSRRDGDR